MRQPGGVDAALGQYLTVAQDDGHPEVVEPQQLGIGIDVPLLVGVA